MKADILSFAELVLNSNDFEFDERHYLQKGEQQQGRGWSFVCEHFYGQVGEARDSECIYAEVKRHIWWRYIDDILFVWTEGEEKLNEFIDYLNNAHDTVKFTDKWSEHCIEFLDSNPYKYM